MKQRALFKILFVIFLLLIIAGSTAYYWVHNVMYKPNINIEGSEKTYLYIRTGGIFDDVCDSLYKMNLIIDKTSFEWLAKKKKYHEKVKPGRYLLNKGMGNNELINMLRQGRQEPVKLIFNNIRTKEQLAGRISKQIEADSAEINMLLNNGPKLEKFGFQTETILAMFIPNTYEFFWDTNEEEFMERMHREYNKFWTEEKIEKAAALGLTAVDVSILASIVQSETTKKDEMSRIAGVYINRLNRGMLLQADPTVVYAWGDFSITRVLFKHLEIDSPYNTYKYSGLPPGPITIPEPTTINAVLNYEKHNYLFFCAKDDLSGYHVFAETHSQHSANARKFQNTLNRLNIKR